MLPLPAAGRAKENVMAHRATIHTDERPVRIPIGSNVIQADLAVPAEPRGVIVFAHGSGSSRHSRRNRYVAGELHVRRFATLLLDLLTADEETIDLRTGHLRFDIELLADRLAGATDWLGP